MQMLPTHDGSVIKKPCRAMPGKLTAVFTVNYAADIDFTEEDPSTVQFMTEKNS